MRFPHVRTQERFIVDVLENFTPIQSYYKLIKTVEDDPEYDVKHASKKPRAFVEGNDHAIRLKSETMVDHFHRQGLVMRSVSRAGHRQAKDRWRGSRHGRDQQYCRKDIAALATHKGVRGGARSRGANAGPR